MNGGGQNKKSVTFSTNIVTRTARGGKYWTNEQIMLYESVSTRPNPKRYEGVAFKCQISVGYRFAALGPRHTLEN